jgi:hypothetical protein
MKKLLVLFMVLGMASAAQAAFQLSVDGLPAPSEITLNVSDTIELDVHLAADDMEFNATDLQIRLSNQQGALDGSGITFPKPTIRSLTFGVWFTLDEQSWGTTTIARDEPQDVVISAGHISWNALNNSTLIDNPYGQPQCPANSFPVFMEGLIFHCEEETDVEIELVAFADVTRLIHDTEGNVIGSETVIPTGTIIDSITVHQVPEPMTMSLLGLGGLALLRRRR